MQSASPPLQDRLFAVCSCDANELPLSQLYPTAACKRGAEPVECMGRGVRLRHGYTLRPLYALLFFRIRG